MLAIWCEHGVWNASEGKYQFQPEQELSPVVQTRTGQVRKGLLLRSRPVNVELVVVLCSPLSRWLLAPAPMAHVARELEAWREQLA